MENKEEKKVEFIEVPVAPFPKLRHKLGKTMGIIGRVLSWIIDIGGLVLALIAFKNPDGKINDLWAIVLGVVCLNTLLWIGFSIYEMWMGHRLKLVHNRHYYEVKQIEMQMESIENTKNNEISDIKQKHEQIIADLEREKQLEIDALKRCLDESIEIRNKCRSFINASLESMHKFKNQALATYTRFIQSMKELGVDEQSPAFSIQQNKYKDDIIFLYNGFLGELISSLKEVLLELLKEKGYTNTISLCVKQLDDVLIRQKSAELFDHYVLTTFRDTETYHQKEREVGKIKYSILGNTAFTSCITKRYFLHNNFTKDDQSYNNETEHFEKFYNCTVVVPIKYGVSKKEFIYGYLTCDTLNNTSPSTEVFDQQMAEICIFASQIIAIFFQSLQYDISPPNGYSNFIQAITTTKCELDKALAGGAVQ